MHTIILMFILIKLKWYLPVGEAVLGFAKDMEAKDVSVLATIIENALEKVNFIDTNIYITIS